MSNYVPGSILNKTVFLRYTPGGQSGIYTLSTNRGTVEYLAVPRNGITLVAVHQDDVNNMLLKMAGCCGNEKRAFVAATQAEIDRWHMSEAEWEAQRNLT